MRKNTTGSQILKYKQLGMFLKAEANGFAIKCGFKNPDLKKLYYEILDGEIVKIHTHI